MLLGVVVVVMPLVGVVAATARCCWICCWFLLDDVVPLMDVVVDVVGGCWML